MNFYRMLVPYLAGAVCIALFAIFMSNVVVPRANYNFQNFKRQHMTRWGRSTTNFHIRNSQNSYIYVDRWNIGDKKGYMFCYDELSDKGVNYRLTALEIHYDDSLKIWKLFDYKKRIVSHRGETLYSGSAMDTIFNITPLDLSQDERACEIMAFKAI
jgi:lipopolysaccharide export system permease protein